MEDKAYHKMSVKIEAGEEDIIGELTDLFKEIEANRPVIEEPPVDKSIPISSSNVAEANPKQSEPDIKPDVTEILKREISARDELISLLKEQLDALKTDSIKQTYDVAHSQHELDMCKKELNQLKSQNKELISQLGSCKSGAATLKQSVSYLEDQLVSCKLKLDKTLKDASHWETKCLEAESKCREPKFFPDLRCKTCASHHTTVRSLQDRLKQKNVEIGKKKSEIIRLNNRLSNDVKIKAKKERKQTKRKAKKVKKELNQLLSDQKVPLLTSVTTGDPSIWISSVQHDSPTTSKLQPMSLFKPTATKHQCSYCSSAYSTQAELDLHKQHFHVRMFRSIRKSDSSVKKESCESDVSSTTSSQPVYSVKRELSPVSSMSAIIECGKCWSQFKTENALNLHMRSHQKVPTVHLELPEIKRESTTKIQTARRGGGRRPGPSRSTLVKSKPDVITL